MSPSKEPHRYPAGVPCWVDTERVDPRAALPFYAELFDWELADAVHEDVPAHYFIATMQGEDVAAIGSLPPGKGDAAPSWITYIACDDLEETMAAVRAAGGEVTTEPRTTGPAGRWVGCADPQGATFRLWEAGARLGSQYVNQPGGWNFSVLLTPDPEESLTFYNEVFDWEVSADLGAGMIRLPGYGEHLAATIDPEIHERQQFAPPGFADVVAGVEQRDGAPVWEVRFTVEDRDASVELAQGAGGKIVTSTETEWVREALIADPEGARFAVSQLAPTGGDDEDEDRAGETDDELDD